jgi:FkbM family methyltransferase
MIRSFSNCGSNIGVSILFFKMLYPKARITGFEPDPFTFDLLTDNVRSNSLTDVELYQCPLGDDDHSITLYRPSEEGASSLRMNVIGKRAVNSASITVQARRLSGFIRDHEIDLLKIDIEGAEHQV